tara:strand:+ start:424 stop:858 length:435 start_codon:yes stop_codon:yes gene_type:complete
MSKLNLRKYKHKYTSIKDIFLSIKKSVRVKSERGSRALEYAEYYSIMEAYLTEVSKVVAEEREVYKLPRKMGKLYIKKEKHIRPFHVRLDLIESERTGVRVYYKVPILDDFYNKLLWERPKKYKKYKALPLSRLKELINETKEY